MLVSSSGELGSRNSLAAQERTVAVVENGSVGHVVCVSLSVSLLFLFPLFAVSVKLPLSQSTSFCLFLSILLHTSEGGGAAVWRFCCWPQPNHNRGKEVDYKIF